MTKSSFKAVLLGAGGVCIVFGAAPATAQDQSPPSSGQSSSGPVTAPQGGEATTGLVDIVVTAQKRAENIQNVPITLNAISASAIERAGGTTTADIPQLVPGITISRVTSNPQIYIRGVGTQNVSTGAEGSNPVYLDGFYNPSLAGALFALNSIERIEVLKGPQGTLFGRNATGGAINVVTRDPSHDTSGFASVGYGNYNTVDSSLYATTGLTDTLAGDISLSVHQQGDGFGKNVFNGQDVNRFREYAGRAKFVFQPSEPLKITVAADYDQTRNTLGFSLRLVDGAVAAITHETAPPNFYDVRENVQPYGFQESYGAQLRAAYDTSVATLVSMSSYRNVTSNFNLDQDASSFSLVNAYFLSDTRAFTQELQVQSLPGSHVQWIVGAFYLNTVAKSDPLLLSGAAFAAAGGSAARYGRIVTNSIAGYAQATLPIGSSSNITAGGRYTYDHKSFDFTQIFPGLDLSTFNSDSHHWGAFTYRLAADHHFTHDIMAYASVSRGYKSGEYGIYAFAPPVNPETLTAYEVGLKTELFDRKLRANAAFFHYDYNNIQLNRIEAGTQVLLNAASAKIDGLDLDFLATPIRHLTFGAGASILFRHDYTSFPNAPATIPNPASVGGNTSTTIDASGFEMIQSPNATFNLNGSYDVPLPGRKDLTFSANYAYNDGFFWEPDHRLRQPAFGLLNAEVRLGIADNRYHLRAWGKNLTNKQYTYYLNTSINDVSAPAPPRTYGLSVDASF